MAIRTLVAAPRFSVDPAEKWEVFLTEKDSLSYFEGTYASRPFTPRRFQDLPDGSWEALADPCGIDDLHQVLVIPWAVRPVGLGRREVISPNSVLAVGTRAVGLWTEKPEPGTKVIIPVEQVAALEDVIILLYGKLSFIPFSQRLTIRYNTVCRRGFEPALVELRKRLAGTPRHLAKVDVPASNLSYKWKNILNSAAVQLIQGAGVEYEFASIPRRTRRGSERFQLVALTPYELVILSDPESDYLRYGEDSYIIPRGKLESVKSAEEGLEVLSNGTRLVLPVTRRLQETVLLWMR